MGFLLAKTAQSAASQSMIFGAAGTAMSMFGDMEEGKQAQAQYLYQAKIAANNAAIQRQNAVMSRASGSYAESLSKTETGRTIASQMAAQAANGVDVAIGSPAEVRDTTRALGAMDAAVLHFNAAREAYGLEMDALNSDNQSALYKAAGKNAKRAAAGKAVSTILSGASALSSKWNTYKQSGAM